MRNALVLAALLIALVIFTGACRQDDSADSAPVEEIEPDPGDDSAPEDDTADDDGDDDSFADDDLDTLTVLDNGDIRVVIGAAWGHILSIRDLRKDIELLRPEADRDDFVPFSYRLLKPAWGGGFRVEDHGPKNRLRLAGPPTLSVEVGEAGGQRRRIQWETLEGASFSAWVDIPPRGAWVDFRARLEIPDEMIYSLTYPYFVGLANLEGDGAGDRMAFPWEGGIEVDDPLYVLPLRLQGRKAFLSMPYPNGHGLMLPLVAYYSPERDGGFLLHARDPEWTERFFSLYDGKESAPGGLPVFEFEARNWDVDGQGGAGLGNMELSHPIRVQAMDHGDWSDAAEIYRRYLESQAASSSPIRDRSEERRRIHEKISLSVFGLSGRVDQSEWMRVFHEHFTGFVEGDGVLFVPGWDFHAGTHPIGGIEYAFYQAGWNESYWLPFAGEFLEMTREARQRGDLVYPFFYDLLIHDGYPGWEGWSGDPASSGDAGAPWESHASVSETGDVRVASFDFFGIPGEIRELCSADPVTRDFYLWRQALLAGGGNPAPSRLIDGLYHDITGTVVGRYCFSRLAGMDHGHDEMGWGRFITRAQKELLSAGQYQEGDFGYGVESVTEPFLELVDFYHLGLSGDGPYRMSQPTSTQENPSFVGFDIFIMNGRGRQIPLVSFVTHAFGPLRTGGKTQISHQVGDAWYWVTAYSYINGGILELIYFNTPADLFDEIDPQQVRCPEGYPCAYMTGWIGLPGARGWFYEDSPAWADPEKIAFLRACADLRLRLGNPFLSAGRMLLPPVFEPSPEDIEMDYDFYSAIGGQPFEHRGSFNAPPLLASAFTDPEDPARLSLFAANVSPEDRSTTLSFDAGRLGLQTPARATMRIAGGNEEIDLGVLEISNSGRVRIPINLKARSLVMIEIGE